MASKSKNKATDKKVVEQLNETGKRKTDRREKSAPIAGERRKVSRRRLIDPTTCERDYSQDEIEFMRSMDEYKRKSGRMFPTCSEILEVIRSMGYRRLSEVQLADEKLIEEQSDCYDLEDREDLECAEELEKEFSQ